MIKESLDSLETKLGKRKEFLFDTDLEKLQNEFIAKKEKCNTKIIKLSVQKNENEQNLKNIIIPTGEIKKKKGKKKVKDVIELNFPSLSNDNYSNVNKDKKDKSENSSLFSINYNKIKENKNEYNINISTGLPDTFKIEEKEKIEKDINIKDDLNIESRKEIEKAQIKENIVEHSEDFKSKEYDEIHKENEKTIQQMSKEEILEAQKEIFANIPSDLLEKFKSNFFSQQIKKSLYEKENKIQKDIKSEENKDIDKNIIDNKLLFISSLIPPFLNIFTNSLIFSYPFSFFI